ncbi:hypothetical protein BN2476_110089 [Paraburkholderia piptadeniae]|uniref:Uncharacterized protein n=1 Tax=Paraburkholderia piptadeniae TaxID=1701573 RepID=A0A1N7RPN9_9BURK|nr:hypothetical protein BN2476_110089 [Paraburkholderia piptadeniae]
MTWVIKPHMARFFRQPARDAAAGYRGRFLSVPTAAYLLGLRSAIVRRRRNLVSQRRAQRPCVPTFCVTGGCGRGGRHLFSSWQIPIIAMAALVRQCAAVPVVGA